MLRAKTKQVEQAGGKQGIGKAGGYISGGQSLAQPERSDDSSRDVVVQLGALGLRFQVFRVAGVLRLRFPTFRSL